MLLNQYSIIQYLNLHQVDYICVLTIIKDFNNFPIESSRFPIILFFTEILVNNFYQ